jgi:hypothetical protein
MRITVPKKQLFVLSTIYYVLSDTGEGKHIVVRNQGTLYCDCRDFITRHLPLLGTPSFSLCKHGEFVRNSPYPLKIEDSPREPKKFGIFVIKDDGTAYLSTSFGTEPRTKKGAQKLLDFHNKSCTNCPFKREVREITEEI